MQTSNLHNMDAMSSFAYIDTLKEQLEKNEITWEQVMSKIHGSKPWRKPDWKTRRADIIAQECGKCGSTEPPLVLQHTWHPAPFSELCEQVRQRILNETDYLAQHPLPEDPPPLRSEEIPPQPFQIRNGCPKCASVNVRQYKDGSWKCNFSGREFTCGHRFATPVVIEHRKYDEQGWINHLESQRRWEAGGRRVQWGRNFMARYRDQITKEAALLSLEEHRRYVSLRIEDVVTRCKKCAFEEDKAFVDTTYQHAVVQERRKQPD